MVDAGLLLRRKDGLNVFYAIADPMVFELCDLVCSRLHVEHERKAAHFRRD
jgi:ArsR family transcriptional regulator